MIIWVLLRIHSHCQWIPVRTVSYRTTSQRAGMRRFLITQYSVLLCEMKTAKSNIWSISTSILWTKKNLWRIQNRSYILSFLFSIIYQTWNRGPYLCTTQTICDFKICIPALMEWTHIWHSWNFHPTRHNFSASTFEIHSKHIFFIEGEGDF